MAERWDPKAERSSIRKVPSGSPTRAPSAQEKLPANRAPTEPANARPRKVPDLPGPGATPSSGTPQSTSAPAPVAGSAVDQCLVPGYWKVVAVPARPATARMLVTAFNACAKGDFPMQVAGATVIIGVTYFAGRTLGYIWAQLVWIDTIVTSFVDNPLGVSWYLLLKIVPYILPLIVLWLLSWIPGTRVLAEKVIDLLLVPVFRFVWGVTFGSVVESVRAIFGMAFSYQEPQEILEGPWDPPTPHHITGDRRSYRGIARIEELSKLADGRDGFRLGRYLMVRNGQALPADELVLPSQDVIHILVSAPAGAGKTRSVVLPFTVSALESGWSTIVFDIKGDMLNSLGGYPEWVARRDGQPCTLRVWGPGVELEQCACYNPLQDIDARDPKRLEAAVEAILGAPPPPGAENDYWDKQYRLYLRLMIRVAKERLGADACPYDLYRMANERAFFEALAEGTSCYRELKDHFARPGERYMEYMGGIISAVQAFGDPKVRKRTLRSDFCFEDLDKERTMLVFTVPQSYKDLGATLLGLFFNAVDAYATTRVESGAKKSRPILIVADEAPTLIKKVNLLNMVSVYRSGKIRCLLVAQEPAMLGEERIWKAIAGNCNVYVMLRGGQGSAIQYAKDWMGERSQQVQEVTDNRAYGQMGAGQSDVYRAEKVAVVADRELKSPPCDFAMWTFCRDVSPKPILTDTRNDFAELPSPALAQLGNVDE